jgi:hypothetical protein
MRRHYGVFEDLSLFNSRFDAGKQFYDNAVYQALRFIFMSTGARRHVGAPQLPEKRAIQTIRLSQAIGFPVFAGVSYGLGIAFEAVKPYLRMHSDALSRLVLRECEEGYRSRLLKGQRLFPRYSSGSSGSSLGL